MMPPSWLCTLPVKAVVLAMLMPMPLVEVMSPEFVTSPSKVALLIQIAVASARIRPRFVPSSVLVMLPLKAVETPEMEIAIPPVAVASIEPVFAMLPLNVTPLVM